MLEDNRYRLGRCLALTCALAICGAAPAQEVTSAPVASAYIPAIGIDLSTLPWYASADLPPDAPPEKIRQLATATSPTVVLRSAAGSSSGMLFCIFDAPGFSGKAFGRVSIGDIDGEDETFLNNTKIGETRGWGVTDFGVPRIYDAPTQAIHVRENVLAVRVFAWRNKSTFGLKRAPFTFALTAEPTHQIVPRAPGAVSDKDTQAAQRAIFESDPQLTSTDGLQRKRAGFGRFGEFLFDGLPGLAEVSPTRIASRKGPVVEVAVDRVTSVGIASGPREDGIDSWHKLTRVIATSAQQEIQYTVHSNVMYPGAVITLERGAVLPLRIRLPSRSGVVLEATPAELRAANLPLRGASQISVYAVCDYGSAAPPLLIGLEGLSANVTQSNEQMEIALAGGSTAGGRAFVWFPTGIGAMKLPGKPASMSELTATADSNSTSAVVLNRWLRLGLNEPVSVDEYFRTLPGEEFVRVYQLAKYRGVAGAPELRPMLMRPPQIDYAVRALHYPVASAATTATGLLTFSGEAYESGSAELSPSEAQSTSDRAPAWDVSWYDLPIPPMNERGLLAAPAQKQMRELFNKWVLSDVGSTNSLTGVDALYKSRTQAFQAFSYLTPDTRARLIADSIRVIPEALGEQFWQPHTEPLSGLQYWWTYFIEGPYFQRFDQDWGNGLSIYGLYNFVKYAGQWELARSKWDSIERMFAWFMVTDDWEWMRASNGAHGHGTGAGDCESATYAACVAYARLAEGCGRDAEHDYGVYMAARAAVFAVNRFAYDKFAGENGLSDKDSYVIGFHEGQGFLQGELDRYPWNITSAISGNGIQPGNFDLYLKYAAEPLRNYEKAFETAYPSWANGRYAYNFETLYKGNSGYITLPHIYLRARLGESADVLHELLDKAVPDNYLWWPAPPVIAEVMNVKAEGPYVADWGRCAFLGGELQRESDGDKRRTRCVLRLDNREAPDFVDFVLPKKAAQFQINDGPVPLTDSSVQGDKLRLKLRRLGLNTIVVQY